MERQEDFVPPHTIVKTALSTLVKPGPIAHVLGRPVVMFVLLDMHVRRGYLLQRHVEMESIAWEAPLREHLVLLVLLRLLVFTVSSQLTSAHPAHLGVTVLVEELLSQDFVMRGISASRTQPPSLIRLGLYPKMRFLKIILVMAEL